MEARDSFKSRLGFILVSAGCAIGIGNVWRFPYVTGEYGGAVFVLFYLLFLVILGIPVVTMELAVGRASRKSVKEGFMKLEPPGTWWHLHGWIALAGSFVLMIYYTTISGWMVDYFVRFLDGSFQGAFDERGRGCLRQYAGKSYRALRLHGTQCSHRLCGLCGRRRQEP